MFMGDTGSLAIGGLVGVIALMVHQPLTLIIVGGIFVMEAGSVILQVASFKSRGKRIFLMSPIHHHFELKGWKETKVVIRFWILSLLFCPHWLGNPQASLRMNDLKLDTEILKSGSVAIFGDGVSGKGVSSLLRKMNWEHKIFSQEKESFTPNRTQDFSLVVKEPWI